MSFFFGRGRRSGVPRNATFRLTQEGRDKLQKFNGDPQSQVLMALETNGTSSVDELADATGLGRGRIERLIPQMAQAGYVSYVGANSGTEVD